MRRSDSGPVRQSAFRTSRRGAIDRNSVDSDLSTSLGDATATYAREIACVGYAPISAIYGRKRDSQKTTFACSYDECSQAARAISEFSKLAPSPSFFRSR